MTTRMSLEFFVVQNSRVLGWRSDLYEQGFCRRELNPAIQQFDVFGFFLCLPATGTVARIHAITRNYLVCIKMRDDVGRCF